MTVSTSIRHLLTQCKIHGNGDAQVMLTDSELYVLFYLSICDLDWECSEFGFIDIEFPHTEYYHIPIVWFGTLEITQATPDFLLCVLDKACRRHQDYSLFIRNLCALHRRRVKYARILSSQPLPGIDQIAPRGLLEYGACNIDLLCNWMAWRKWVYDIDNRVAQETGYFFEPVLASCLGGESIGAKHSPVKRLDSKGRPTDRGRQVDCFVSSLQRVYELKLRVSIAASGQGRFSEELSFPIESAAAGFTPILLVLDPTPSNRLEELERAFLSANGKCFSRQEAWGHMEEAAGDVISQFIDKYIKPPLEAVENGFPARPCPVTLAWEGSQVRITIAENEYVIPRSSVLEGEDEDTEN
jgi:hypothetical protein